MSISCLYKWKYVNTEFKILDFPSNQTEIMNQKFVLVSRGRKKKMY